MNLRIILDGTPQIDRFHIFPPFDLFCEQIEQEAAIDTGEFSGERKRRRTAMRLLEYGYPLHFYEIPAIRSIRLYL